MNFSQVLYYEWWHWSNPDFPTFTGPLETVFWYTGDIKSGASELTATLTPSTVLTARYTLNDTPYGDIGVRPQPEARQLSLTSPARIDLLTERRQRATMGRPMRFSRGGTMSR